MPNTQGDSWRGPKKQHKMSDTKLYRTFAHMRQRCTNPKAPNYHKYGAKGITCDWTSFEDFRRDMEDSFNAHVAKHGEKNTSIDRIDGTKGYYKENCRWATWTEQNKNRTLRMMLTHDGRTQNLVDWCKELGINKNTVRNRIQVWGWDVSKALTHPVQVQIHRTLPADSTEGRCCGNCVRFGQNRGEFALADCLEKTCPCHSTTPDSTEKV